MAATVNASTLGQVGSMIAYTGRELYTVSAGMEKVEEEEEEGDD